jgi:hypothetical protein
MSMLPVPVRIMTGCGVLRSGGNSVTPDAMSNDPLPGAKSAGAASPMTLAP